MEFIYLKPGTYTFKIIKFFLYTKIYRIQKIHKKNSFKVALQYFFNGVILYNTYFYSKFSFILKINQKIVLKKACIKLKKPCKSFQKIFGNFKLKIQLIYFCAFEMQIID